MVPVIKVPFQNVYPYIITQAYCPLFTVSLFVTAPPNSTHFLADSSIMIIYIFTQESSPCICDTVLKSLPHWVSAQSPVHTPTTLLVSLLCTYGGTFRKRSNTAGPFQCWAACSSSEQIPTACYEIRSQLKYAKGQKTIFLELHGNSNLEYRTTCLIKKYLFITIS